MVHNQATHHVLPETVTGPVDILRLMRELDSVDDYLEQAAIRSSQSAANLPKTSAGLENLARVNHLNLLDKADRKQLHDFLDDMHNNAPVLHISFSADPSAAFTTKIVIWLRRNVHKFTLVQIGLQPSIGAGCTVRTTNKVFDFSLRQYLLKNRLLLVSALAKISQQSSTGQSQTTTKSLAMPLETKS